MIGLTRIVLSFPTRCYVPLDSICQTGLDPARRRGQALGPGEYFGGNASVSLPYCKGGRKMLVFAVLTDKSGVTSDTPGVVVVHKPEHQLPLFVLTFTANPAQLMAAAARRAGGAAASATAQLFSASASSDG